MSKWKRFTTSTGSTYEVIDDTRWRKNADWLDPLWEFAAVPPWEDNRSEVVKGGLIEWSRKNGDMMRWPEVGECLYILGREVWWLSTPIVEIEEWEEDE